MKSDSVLKIMSSVLEVQKTILNEFVPEEAQQHFRSSHREFLRGVIGVLEHICSESESSVANDVKNSAEKNRSIDITE